MSLKVSQISYQDLIAKEDSLRAFSIAYLSDWSELNSGIRYYAITDGKTGNLKGGFFLFSQKRLGMTHYCNPPFFQDIGLWIKKEFDSTSKQNSQVKNVLVALSNFLKSFKWVNISLPNHITDTQPFIWDNFEVSPRYTYLLDLSRSKEELKNNFGKGLKHSIKKMENTEFIYDFKMDEDTIGLIETSSLKGRGKDEKLVFKKLIQNLSGHSSAKVIKASDGQSVSVAVFLIAGNNAVYLFGGSRNSSGSVVGTAVIQKGIESFKENGMKVLDFEGSMIPGVEKYFRSFGGELVPMFNIKKTPKFLRLKAALSS